jgi:dihydroorotate dehydrogenase
MKLFISPPFGNYIDLPCTTPIRGSYTIDQRSGLFSQVLKTLRFSYENNGWINKIGLRNKGIDWALKNYSKYTDNNGEILSIALMNEEDIDNMNRKIPDAANIEINVSCPNAEKRMINEGLHNFINPLRRWCIIKVSPTIREDELDKYYKQGFRQFHCSNTLPTPKGGLSGEALMPYNKQIIGYLKENYKDVEVIGGGGVKTWKDVEKYKEWGADHVAISTICFNPWMLMKLYIDYLKNL